MSSFDLLLAIRLYRLGVFGFSVVFCSALNLFIKLQILLAILPFALKPSDALTCLQCTDASAPRNCGTVKKCGSHEACFIDEYINSAGYLRYDVGCRDSQFCTSFAGRRSISDAGENFHSHTTNETVPDDAVMRSSSHVKVCESCCNTDLCNNAGCKATGYPSRRSRGPICYTCAKQQTPEQCDAITLCGIDSVCKVKLDHHAATGEIYYSSTCENAQVCHQDAVFQTAIVGRKRLTEEVDTATNKCVVKCCDGDLCNGVCGTGSVATGTGSTGTTNPCFSNPCVFGSCSVSQGIYVCTCTNGAYGRNCDTLPNPCLNNPCQQGTCHSSGSTYHCTCTTGYTGTNCDQVINPCHNNQCGIHGTCIRDGKGYSCRCTSPYSGMYCDKVVYNPCSPDPCIHGTCTPNGDRYHCSCYHGYVGDTCNQYQGSSSGGSCSSGWVKYGSSCYLVKKEKADWTEAKHRCSSHGAHLVEVGSDGEEQFLIQQGPVAHQGDWWLGATRHGSRWTWTSGRTIHSSHWGSGAPSNNGFNCLELKKVTRAWNNEDCHHDNYYFCEKSA